MARPAPFTNLGKICTKCGQDKLLSDFFTTGKKVDGSPKYQSWCKPCISAKMSSYHRRIWGAERLQYTAYKRTRTDRAYLTYLLSKAKRRGECTITLDDLCHILHKQNGKCAITGWQMTMRLADGVVPTNMSIDRINSDLGYHLGNVQLVCRCVNVAKSDLTMLEFVKMCRAVVENSDG